MRRFAAVFILLSIPYLSAAAEEATPLEEITVRPVATPSRSGSDAATPRVSVGREALQRNRASVVPALDGAGGISFRHYGGLQNYSAISIRGSKPEQVTLYLDGIPLQGGGGSIFSLGDIPPSLLEGVDVTKGFAPPVRSQSSIGGTVTLSTTPVARGRQLRLGGGYGSFGTATGEVKAGFGDESGRGVVAGYNFIRTDGDFNFLDDGGTPLAPADDREVARRNNQSQSHAALVKGVLPVGSDAILSLEDLFLQKEQGIAGLGMNASSQASLRSLGNHLAIETGIALPGRWFKETELTGFASFERQHYSDPLGDIGLGLQQTETTTWRYGLDNSWGGQIDGWHLFKAGWHFSQDLYQPFNSLASDPSGATSRREVVSLWIADDWALGDGRVHLFPSLRTEHVLNHLAGRDPTLSGLATAADNNSSYHPVSGRLGAFWEVVSSLLVSANLSRSLRIPSFSELYGDRGLVQGNPGLVPESGWNGDVGLHAQFSWGRGTALFVDGSGYEHRSQNLIQFVQTSQRTARAENISSSRARGVEAGARLVVTPWGSVEVDYTYQVVRNTSALPGGAGKLLPGHPRHEVKLTADAVWREVRPFATVHYLDGNFLDTQNLFETKHRWILGAGTAVRFLRHFEARVEGRNLLGDQVVDVLGFPLPGRSFFGQISYEI